MCLVDTLLSAAGVQPCPRSTHKACTLISDPARLHTPLDRRVSHVAGGSLPWRCAHELRTRSQTGISAATTSASVSQHRRRRHNIHIAPTNSFPLLISYVPLLIQFGSSPARPPHCTTHITAATTTNTTPTTTITTNDQLVRKTGTMPKGLVWPDSLSLPGKGRDASSSWDRIGLVAGHRPRRVRGPASGYDSTKDVEQHSSSAYLRLNAVAGYPSNSYVEPGFDYPFFKPLAVLCLNISHFKGRWSRISFTATSASGIGTNSRLRPMRRKSRWPIS